MANPVTVNGSNEYPDIDFIDEQTGYITGYNTVEKTIDGGQTWNTVVRSKSPIVEIHFIDSKHGWAADASGVLRYNEP